MMSDASARALPEAFKARIAAQLGKDADAFFHSLHQPAPVSIRHNPAKPFADNLTGEPIPWCKTGFYLRERPVFTLDPRLHAGCYYVQEPGSMLLELLMQQVLLQSQGPLVVLDLCAAPGGKTTHLLSLLPEGSCLVSNEPVPGRNNILRENTARWGKADIIHTQNEAAAFAAAPVQFDVILVDAPCSGEGLFRKDPAATSEWSERQAAGCAMRQQQILDTIDKALKPGGYLIYSTCTYNPAENEAQAEGLIRTHGYKACMPPTPAGIEPCVLGWQAWPHKVQSEGFYCVLLKKDGNVVETGRTRSRKPTHLKAVTLPEAKEWITQDKGFELFSHGDFVYAMRESCMKMSAILAGDLYLRQTGLPVAEIKGRNLVPLHPLALSTDLSESVSRIDVDLECALRYLRGNDPGISIASPGWHLLRYEQAGLGWIKAIGNRINNYYPAPLRIKMK